MQVQRKENGDVVIDLIEVFDCFAVEMMHSMLDSHKIPYSQRGIPGHTWITVESKYVDTVAELSVNLHNSLGVLHRGLARIV